MLRNLTTAAATTARDNFLRGALNDYPREDRPDACIGGYGLLCVVRASRLYMAEDKRRLDGLDRRKQPSPRSTRLPLLFAEGYHPALAVVRYARLVLRPAMTLSLG